MTTRERPPKPYETSSTALSQASSGALTASRGLRSWEREAATGNRAALDSATSTINGVATSSTAQPPVPGNGSRPPASTRTWERSNGRYSSYGGYDDDYYGGNYGSSYGNSYGGRYGSYGGYGSRYGSGYGSSLGYGNSYGGYGNYGGYGGYDEYDKFGRMGPHGRRYIDQGFSWVGNVQSVTDGFGRFASLLDANSQAMHGMLSSIIRLIDNVGMLYKEIGFFISSWTIVRLVTRLFRRMLGRTEPSSSNALVPASGFDVSEFSAKQGGAETPKTKGAGWAGFLATIALICMGIPAIVYLFKRASRALRELDAATGGAPLDAPVQGALRVRALYDYSPQSENELSMREGDVIRVIGQLNDDWWEGEIEGRRGFMGIFPANYVQILPPQTQKSAEPLGQHYPMNPMSSVGERSPLVSDGFDEFPVR